MFIDLPQPIQQQVLYYLEADNFTAAKQLHDQYMLPFSAHTQSHNYASELRES